jgi:DNA-directed RNA polymerase beta' subunit
LDIFLDLAIYFKYSSVIDLDSDDEEEEHENEEEDYHNYDDEEYFKYLRERPQYKRKTMEEKYNENIEKEMIMLINDSLSKK